MFDIRLDSVVDWTGFSRGVRHLIAAGIGPEAVRWRVGAEAAEDLLAPADSCEARTLSESPPLNLPRAFVEAARDVFLHEDSERLVVLHRLSARLAADPRAWADSLDSDRLRFERLLQEVRREIHKMHAFVRFRPLASAVGGAAVPPGEERYVAWFEPAHHIVERSADFFVRRFSSMRWAILTPRVSVAWDGHALETGEGTTRASLPPADAGEALWLAYYRSIFNPARVKVAMMKKEMPVRFWKNLPEAAAIGPLIAGASQRQSGMVANAADETARRRTLVARAPSSPCAAGAIPEAALETLRRRAAQCRECPVAEHATQVVFGEGSPHAGLMIVGEQPGHEEDLRGRPFQGPAGRVLRDAFDRLGWDPSGLWLTNAVKHFHHELRGKRRMHKTPGQLEAQECLRWLEAEIATVQPRAIVALGATATRSLLGRAVAVREHEGRWLERADGIPVLVCLHPAAILRTVDSQRADVHAHWIESLRAADRFAREASQPDFAWRLASASIDMPS